MAEKGKNPVRAISLMMFITLVGKVLGLIRDRMLAVNYGTGMEANAFMSASRMPRVFFDAVFASAISASFIPVFSEYMVKRGKKDAYTFAGNFIAIIFAASVVLTALCICFASELTMFFADGYDAETAALCTALSKIMFPTMVFTGVAYSFVGILQSYDEFNIPALISVVSNAVVIVYYIFFNDRFGIYGLAVAFLAAWLMQALIQIPALMKKGVKLHISLKNGGDGLKKVFALMLPVMVSTWVLPINQTVNSKFSSRLFDGAGVSAVEYAYNLYTIIVGVFVLSVTNFIFPRLSKQSAGSESKAFEDTVNTSMHASLFFVIPMTAGLMILSEPLVRFIYAGGEFDSFSVEITSRALLFMSLGMVGYTVQNVLSRAFFARQSGRVPMVSGAISIAVNLILCAVLFEAMDVAGIALASAAAATAGGIALIIPLRRQGVGVFGDRFMADIGKMTVCTLIMAASAYLSLRLVSGVGGFVGGLLSLAVPAVVGAAVYFISSAIIGIEEAKAVAAKIGIKR